MGRSILAVVAGIVVWDVLWISSNQAIIALFPSHFGADGSSNSAGLLLVLIAFGFVFGLIAGYITARLAPVNIPRHVLILALIQLPQGILVEILYWDLLPLWYHIGFLLLLVPGFLMGGRLRESQLKIAT